MNTLFSIINLTSKMLSINNIKGVKRVFSNRAYSRKSTKVLQTNTSTIPNVLDNLDNKTLDNKTLDTSKLFIAISELEEKYNIKLNGFPHAVVVGSQSSGKSSVIEGICGESILPKSMKMATLKPIHLTTIRSTVRKFKIGDKEVFTAVEAGYEIERLNNNSHVTKINVIIWSPDVYNAKLVDLPGLFVVATKEMSDLPKKVKDLNTTYLQDLSIIPVIVHAGPSDPATDQALKLINKLGREDHTLGIITKVDMLEKQKMSFVEEMLKGDTYPLGHGYCAVILRNDKDIDAEMTINDKMKEESEFFNRFRLQPSGVLQMRKKLSAVQFGIIKTQIPKLISDVDAQIVNLTMSQSFMSELVNNDQKKLAGKLKMMIEKLVGSSLQMAEFEGKLKQEFKGIIGVHLQKTFGTIRRRYKPIFSNKPISNAVMSYNHQNKTNPVEYQIDGIKELFSYGLVSPTFIDNQTINETFSKELNLALSVPMLDICINDPLGKKRLEWNRCLNSYFATLLNDENIHKMIHDITEKSLLEYIYSDPEGFDAVTKKFAEYMITEIGNEAYESNIKYSITATLNLEKRPQVSIFEIVRYVTQMYPDNFTFDGSFMENTFREGRKIKLEVYGSEWNEAYLRVVGDKLTENTYRNVAVNLIDKMVEKLLEFSMDLFNKENAIKEQNKINEKVVKLNEIKNIIVSYSNSNNE